MTELINTEHKKAEEKMLLVPIRETNILPREKIMEAEPLLKATIQEINYSTLALVNDLMERYEHQLLQTPDLSMNEFYENYSPNSIEFNRKGEGNTCVGMCADLKGKLQGVGIKSFMVPYGSGLFDRSVSNDYIESSHTALIVPFLSSEGKKYALFDPGLTISKPIIFSRDLPSDLVVAGNRVCKVEPTSEENYTHILNIYDTSQLNLDQDLESQDLKIAKRIKFNANNEWKNQDETMIKRGYRCIEDMKTQNFDSEGREISKLVIRLRTQKILIQTPEDKKIFRFAEVDSNNSTSFEESVSKVSYSFNIDTEILKTSILRIIKWEQDYKSQIWLPEIRN